MNLAKDASDLTFSDPKNNEHLCEDNEAIGVLEFGIFWIIIVNNPKGTYRVDDGWNTDYTNSIDEAIRLMNKFITENQ